MAALGPLMGPLIGGFAYQNHNWRWTIWAVVAMAGSLLLILTFLLPETSPDKLLRDKAERLRRQTGDARWRAACELEGKASFKDAAKVHLVRPFQLLIFDPIGQLSSTTIDLSSIQLIHISAITLGLSGLSLRDWISFLWGFSDSIFWCIWMASRSNWPRFLWYLRRPLYRRGVPYLVYQVSIYQIVGDPGARTSGRRVVMEHDIQRHLNSNQHVLGWMVCAARNVGHLKSKLNQYFVLTITDTGSYPSLVLPFLDSLCSYSLYVERHNSTSSFLLWKAHRK